MGPLLHISVLKITFKKSWCCCFSYIILTLLHLLVQTVADKMCCLSYVCFCIQFCILVCFEQQRSGRHLSTTARPCLLQNAKLFAYGKYKWNLWEQGRRNATHHWKIQRKADVHIMLLFITSAIQWIDCIKNNIKHYCDFCCCHFFHPFTFSSLLNTGSDIENKMMERVTVTMGKQAQKDICVPTTVKYVVCIFSRVATVLQVETQPSPYWETDWFASDANINWRLAAVMTQLRQQKQVASGKRERFDFLLISCSPGECLVLWFHIQFLTVIN